VPAAERLRHDRVEAHHDAQAHARDEEVEVVADAGTGNRRINAQLEARSVPIPIWVVRVGGVVFDDGGGAADSYRRMRVQDVGFGLRMLVPHTSRELFRFDLAFPLNDAPGTRAGRPRFIAGFDSYF
jgi:hypothetical protein